MKKLILLKKPNTGADGGQTTEPQNQNTEPVKTTIQNDKNDNEIVIKLQKEKEELTSQINSLNDKIKILEKDTSNKDSQIKQFENQIKDNEYQSNFIRTALDMGAKKPFLLYKLGNKEKDPKDDIKELKEQNPELFEKPVTIKDIGGGVTGTTTTNYSLNDIEKMSLQEYKKWREKNQ